VREATEWFVHPAAVGEARRATEAARLVLARLAADLLAEGLRVEDLKVEARVPAAGFAADRGGGPREAPRPSPEAMARRRFAAGLGAWVRAAGLFAEALYADGLLRAPLEPGGPLAHLQRTRERLGALTRQVRETLYLLDALAERVARGDPDAVVAGGGGEA
jgi:hypothetical protein